jgi:hypothetical protein
MKLLRFSILLFSLFTKGLNAQQIIDGQIFTPGIAVVDAPQPNTPLGGGGASPRSSGNLR